MKWGKQISIAAEAKKKCISDRPVTEWNPKQTCCCLTDFIKLFKSSLPFGGGAEPKIFKNDDIFRTKTACHHVTKVKLFKRSKQLNIWF